MRLGVYVDDVYRVDDARGAISTDRAFLLFVIDVGRHVDRLVMFGRAVHTSKASEYVLPSTVRLVELPFYERVTAIRDVIRTAPASALAMWRGLAHVDAVWVFGPQPLAILMVVLARLRKKHVVLGIRQDTVAYYRARLNGREPTGARLAISLLDLCYRVLARSLPTAVVGSALSRAYGGAPALLPFNVSLVRKEDVVDAPRDDDWAGVINLLTVSRLEPEKNPLLLVDVLARLNARRPAGFRLTWIGSGVLEAEVRQRAAEVGVDQSIELRGYIAFGPQLLELYRSAHVFVHAAVTEGVPQVLLEAMACGTPIVATAVGGVAEALHYGEAGLLVPPRSVEALADAIALLCDSPDLRTRLVARGLRIAAETSIDVEAPRVAAFLHQASRDRRTTPFPIAR
jgi:glycosyltransferase involved in cell wall biosynthesis